MSTTTESETRAEAYLAEVRSHLAGLGDDERDDLLDDLTAHVHQVAADDERSLEDALGSPEAFAAELLASAGLTAEMPDPRPGLVTRAQRRLDAAVDAIRRQPAGRAVLDFLPELRPAWWVARGWLVVYLLTMAANGTADSFPFPEVVGSWVLGAALAFLGAVLSVGLGRRTKPPRWVWIVNVVAIAAIVIVANDTHPRASDTIYIDNGGNGVSAQDVDRLRLLAETGLQHGDGSPVSNIYAYDANGQPLDRVRLYDQDGRPIEAFPGYDANGNPLTVAPVFGADGQVVTNAYPQHQSTTPLYPGDPAGNIAVPPPVVGVAPLPAAGTVTTSTTVPAPAPSTTTTVPGSVP
ncbi:MAG TPA: hypothetical protein VH479_12205 [Acidimicrobiales bacterium]